MGKQKDLDLVNVPAIAWVFDPSQPHAWLDMTLRQAASDWSCNRCDPKHSKHGQRIELKWAA